jgi:hypothetical protein
MALQTAQEDQAISDSDYQKIIEIIQIILNSI